MYYIIDIVWIYISEIDIHLSHAVQVMTHCVYSEVMCGMENSYSIHIKLGRLRPLDLY